MLNETQELSNHYKWDLTDLFASDESWRVEKDRFQKDMHKVTEYRGKLISSSSILLEALDLNAQLAKDMVRLYSYASMSSDQDTRVTKYMGMTQEMQQLASEVGALSS